MGGGAAHPGAEPAAEAGRGRAAEGPTQVPAAGWRDVAWRVKEEVSSDRLTLVAAGVAFYALLALAPSLAALVSIYGLVADPGQIESQLQQIGGLPDQVRSMVLSQLRSVAGASSSALGLSLVISVGLALWSASKGINAIIVALNIVHDEKEERGTLKQTALSLAFTLAVVVGAAVGIAVIAGVPAALGRLGLGPLVRIAAVAVPWLVLLLGVLGLLAFLYRFGTDRKQPRWRWVTPGSLFATVAWAVASVVFSVYVANFGSYNETYGSLGGVVVMLLWLWLSALVVLIGAELNSELERQTRRDSTAGEETPLGARGAHAADTVGPTP